MQRIKILGLIISLMLLSIKLCGASAIDLSWSAPTSIETGDNSSAVVWHYYIENNSTNALEIPVYLHLITSNEVRHDDSYNKAIFDKAAKDDDNGKGYAHSTTLPEKLGPGKREKCMAVFENIDPEAKKIDIYVLGLRHFSFWRPAMREYIYRITYKRSLKNSWRLIEHDFSKDTKARYKPFE